MTTSRSGHSLLWKELRALRPFGGAFLALEVAGMAIFWRGFATGIELPSTGVFLAITLVLWGAILGLVSFGAERESETWPLLQSLALAPWAVLRAKTAAAALVLAALTLARLLGLAAFGSPMAPGSVSSIKLVALVLAVILAFCLGAWWSTTTRPLSAVAGSLVLLGLGATAAGATGSVVGWIAFEAVALLVLLTTLERWIANGSLVETTRWPGQGLLGSSARRLDTGSAIAVFWRAEGRRMVWVVALPLLLLVVPMARSKPWFLFLPIPLLAAWVGAGMVSRDELQTVSFFLHHLPIARWRLFLPRLLLALACGPLLVASSGLAATLSHRLGWASPLWQQATVLPTLLPAFLELYVLACLAAAALAPWLGQRLLVTALALVTMIQLAAAGWTLAESPVRGMVSLALLGVVAGWSLAWSPASGPTPGKRRRALWGVVVLWAFLTLIAWR